MTLVAVHSRALFVMSVAAAAAVDLDLGMAEPVLLVDSVAAAVEPVVVAAVDEAAVDAVASTDTDGYTAATIVAAGH